MPALNTPQFSWVKSRLPNSAQPVPPIFQPEVAARAIVWAADNDRRELWVGGPTYEAILGQKVAPGLLDRYLGNTGYDSQQTYTPADPDSPHNLWEPQDEHIDHGARGSFDEQATDHSRALQLTEQKNKLSVALGLAAGGVLLGVMAARRSNGGRRHG